MNVELSDYINKSKNAGQTDDQIKNDLLKNGWTVNDIQEVQGIKVRDPLSLISLPWLWFFLTLIYSVLFFKFANSPSIFLYVKFLGLFVPMGLLSAFVALSKGSIFLLAFCLVFILAVIFGGEIYLRKLNLNIFVKIFVILGILFLSTIVVDFILFGGWASLKLLLETQN